MLPMNDPDPAPKNPLAGARPNPKAFVAEAKARLVAAQNEIRLRVAPSDIPTVIRALLDANPRSWEEANAATETLELFLADHLTPAELRAKAGVLAQRIKGQPMGEIPESVALNAGDDDETFLSKFKALTSLNLGIARSNFAKTKTLGSLIQTITYLMTGSILLMLVLYLWANVSFVLPTTRPTAPIPVFFLAMLAGAMGSMVSTARQLASEDIASGSAMKSAYLELARRTVYAPVAGGAIFGLFIFIFCCSGLAGQVVGEAISAIIPFAKGEPPPLSTSLTRHLADPEFFKLLIWCFAAGFLPSLVPDFIESLVKRTKKDQAGDQ